MRIFQRTIANTVFNIFTLSFSKEKEAEYLNRYFKESLNHVRGALIVAVFFYGIFGILDITLAPAYKNSFWFIRFALVIPYFLLVFLLSFSRHFQKYMQLGIAFGVLFAGIGIIWMILIGPETIISTYYAGLILVFFYGYTFFKLRFIWATIAGWVIVLIYEIAAIWFTNTPIPILINNNFFFLAGNFMGMFAGYSIEYYSRRDFITEQLLEADKKEIDEINSSLEKNVSERTSELVKANTELKQEISDRKRAQDLLFESEQKYRNLFEKSRDAIFISSAEGKILDINPAGVEMFGYESKEEIFDIDISQNLFSNADDRDDYIRLLEENGHITDFEMILKRKDKQKLIVHETATVIKNESGQIIAYHGILRDVTEKTKIQNQLFQVQKMESIGLLAGGVAHDFNNILTAINGYAEILLLKMDKKSPFYDNVQSIRKGGERANNLTRQLLAFSRKQVHQLKIVNINNLIENLDKMIHRLIGEDIRIKKRLYSEIHSIKADPGQVEQIIVNLAINARDAINQRKNWNREKCITISTKNIYLDQEFVKSHAGSTEGKFILLSLSDTGIGMDELTIEKIFEPFFTTKELGKGTGLGLSTIYGIVKQNKAYIYVSSEIDSGTTFEIYWPSEGKKTVLDEEEEQTGNLLSGSETILFVEDDIQVREFTSEALKSLGYDVIAADNGKEALSILSNRSKNIKLLFTDLVMPEMGGKELADIVSKVDPSLKILFTSGYSENHVIERGIQKKKVNFIQKPYTFHEISREIRKILES